MRAALESGALAGHPSWGQGIRPFLSPCPDSMLSKPLADNLLCKKLSPGTQSPVRFACAGHLSLRALTAN